MVVVQLSFVGIGDIPVLSRVINLLANQQQDRVSTYFVVSTNRREGETDTHNDGPYRKTKP